MKTSSALALAFAISLASASAAFATEEGVATFRPHHYHHHHVVHEHVYHHVPTAPVVVAPPAPAAQAEPFGLAWPHIAPYPDNKGDEDGLSEDQNDCNKGCIDGNAPD